MSRPARDAMKPRVAWSYQLKSAGWGWNTPALLPASAPTVPRLLSALPQPHGAPCLLDTLGVLCPRPLIPSAHTLPVACGRALLRIILSLFRVAFSERPSLATFNLKISLRLSLSNFIFPSLPYFLFALITICYSVH